MHFRKCGFVVTYESCLALDHCQLRLRHQAHLTMKDKSSRLIDEWPCLIAAFRVCSRSSVSIQPKEAFDNVDPQPVRSLEEWLIGDLFPYTRHSQIVSEAFILQSLASLQTSPKATKQGPTTVPIMAEAVVSRGSKQ
jgi:hypothetical protein